MAPEIAKKKPYNAKIDVFSFAILCWQLLALEKPFANHKDSEAALGRILQGERPPLKAIEELPLSAEDNQTLQQFLQKGWSKKIEERPTMAVVHKLLSKIAPSEEGVMLTSDTDLSVHSHSHSDDGSTV
jgi:Protein kinase domain